MFDLTPFTDYGLVCARVMVGAIYIDSGDDDLKKPEARATSTGLPKAAVIGLAIAEIAGGLGIVLGVLQQLAAIGLMLVMLGAIQKKIFVWKTGFWGSDGLGWYYDLTLISVLLVILFTDGGRFVLLP